MPYSRGTCQVLVVEDDPLSRTALTALLRHVGCSAYSAQTVGEALALLDGKTHVVTDLVLTDASGIELLRLIRRRGLHHHVAVVTALERDHPLALDAAQFEPEIVLRKPIDVEALLGWLDHSQA